MTQAGRMVWDYCYYHNDKQILAAGWLLFYTEFCTAHYKTTTRLYEEPLLTVGTRYLFIFLPK